MQHRKLIIFIILLLVISFFVFSSRCRSPNPPFKQIYTYNGITKDLYDCYDEEGNFFCEVSLVKREPYCGFDNVLFRFEEIGSYLFR